MTMVNPFQQILQHAADRKKNGAVQTHTDFSQYSRPLSVEDEPTFLDAYVEAVTRGQTVSVTERVGETFPFFVDIDFQVEWFIEGHISEGKLHEKELFALLRDILETLEDTISEHTGKEAEPADTILALRCAYKAHVHFPYLFVDKTQARCIILDVQSDLRERHPSLDWGKILDSMPYSSGLRMLGSVKGTMKNATARAQEVAKHEQAGFQTGFSEVYAVVKWDRKSCHYEPLPTTRFLIEEVSIRRPGEKVAFVAPVQNAEAPRRPALSSSTQVLPKVAYEFVGSISPQLIAMGVSRPTPVKFREYPGGGNFEITLEPQVCPFLWICHKRTRCENKPTSWLHVSRKKCELRCFACGDEVPGKLVRDAKVQMLYPKLKPAGAIERVLTFATAAQVVEFVMKALGDGFAASPCGQGYKWFSFDREAGRWVQQETIVLAIMEFDGPVQSALRMHKKLGVGDSGELSEPEDGSEPDEVALTRSEGKGGKCTVDDIAWCTQTTGYVQGQLLPVLARKYDARWRRENRSFEEQLDENAVLLCCANGVYDLAEKRFRRAEPTDMLSMCTHVPYVPYEKYPEDVRVGLDSYLRRIFTVDGHRDYFLRELGASLKGTMERQQFFLMTGRGANGKSTLMLLKSISLGDYSGEVPVSMFTQTRPPTEDATPVLINMRGKRVIDTSEPESSSCFMMGSIKPLTGGDKITGRRLRENSTSFYLQCTIFCQTNDIPQIKASRHGEFPFR